MRIRRAIYSALSSLGKRQEVNVLCNVVLYSVYKWIYSNNCNMLLLGNGDITLGCHLHPSGLQERHRGLAKMTTETISGAALLMTHRYKRKLGTVAGTHRKLAFSPQ